jgi:A/G-specific adenine glycosylase
LLPLQIPDDIPPARIYFHRMPRKTTTPAIAPPDPDAVRSFRRKVYRYFAAHGRVLPWRTGYDPYHIIVSEIMLQQTQVDRVAVKFPLFVNRFPDVRALADAPLEAVLREWQGLGYNRRATALREAAKIIVADYGGRVPDDPELLVKLPGIGAATAASIAAFAFNRPTLFLETNIRTVLIHHFAADRRLVDDEVLLPVAAAVLDRRNPRKWYSALMDYGTMLKKNVGNLSRNSASYKKQSRFEGSRRQVRGAILQFLLKKGAAVPEGIANGIDKDLVVVEALLDQLATEKILVKTGRQFRISG